MSERICKYGDPNCPCPDGDPCHYEGKDAFTPPEQMTNTARIAIDHATQQIESLKAENSALKQELADEAAADIQINETMGKYMAERDAWKQIAEEYRGAGRNTNIEYFIRSINERFDALSSDYPQQVAAAERCDAIIGNGKRRCSAQKGHGGQHIWLNPVMADALKEGKDK
jgi:hypothetical protein